MSDPEFKVDTSPLSDIPALLESGQISGDQSAEIIRRLLVTIDNLNETVADLTRRLYGRSREKLPFPGQMSLFSEEPAPTGMPETAAPLPEDVPGTAEALEKPRKRTRSKRKDLFRNVPTEELVIPVPEEERTCGNCGSRMEAIGRKKVRDEYKITPMKVTKVEIYEEVVACSKCKDEYGDFAFKKANAPAPLISRSMASPSAVAYVICQKLVNYMPFYRIEQDLESMGVPLARETMAQWLISCAQDYFLPLYQLMFAEQKSREILHADETWCQVLREPGKEAASKSYIWLIVTGDDGLPRIVTYHYAPTRAHEIPEDLLRDFTGFLHTDKYGGYNCLGDHVIRCLCWAHGRRKWYEAISPEIRKRDCSGLHVADLTPAEIGFLYCQKLFDQERSLKKLSFEERKAKRLELERPVLDSFWSWLKTLGPVGGSKLEKAVNYFSDSREEFENYLKDGRCSLSNNWAENSARPYVVGRKNFLFHNSVAGAEASAVIYSIVLTAKANNLDIRKYIETVLQRMPDYENEPDGIRKLLPWSPEMQDECHKLEVGKTSR